MVEVWDVTAQDPKLLVYLKAYRNTVPVPRHWSQKRKYLQGKRGLEKPPFKLPDFIEATGIGEMRQAYQEKVRPADQRMLASARDCGADQGALSQSASLKVTCASRSLALCYSQPAQHCHRAVKKCLGAEPVSGLDQKPNRKKRSFIQ